MKNRSNDKIQNIDLQKHIEQELLYNPDYIIMGEIKGNEAYKIQEAARAGHPITSTLHTKHSMTYDLNRRE